MGYSVFIERQTGTDERSDITVDEWRAYVTSASDFELTEMLVTTNRRTGAPIHVPGEAYGIWTRPDGTQVAFDYRRGVIGVNFPDDETIEKMKDIAAILDGIVIGEEGERY